MFNKNRLQAQLHEYLEGNAGYGEPTQTRILSITVHGRKIFMCNESIFDARGTHYGHMQETWTRIGNPKAATDYARVIGTCYVCPQAIISLLCSKTGQIMRSSHFEHEENSGGKWHERTVEEWRFKFAPLRQN